MIRSTMVFTAVLTAFATPAQAQDRRASEAEAAAAEAERAAADAVRASQSSEAQEADEPAEVAPVRIEPLAVEPEEIAPLVSAPVEEAPAIDWIAEPVVQALGESPVAAPAGLAIDEQSGPRDDAEPAFSDAAGDALPLAEASSAPAERQLADAAAVEDEIEPAPRPVRRPGRRVRLAYSSDERAAWLAQCSLVYRNSYDCEGYLAQYEKVLGVTTPADRAAPLSMAAPVASCEDEQTPLY